MNFILKKTVIVFMEDLYHSISNSQKQDDKESAHRKLKRLRFLLIMWLVSFIVSMLWFSFSPGI